MPSSQESDDSMIPGLAFWFSRLEHTPSHNFPHDLPRSFLIQLPVLISIDARPLPTYQIHQAEGTLYI